MGPLRRVSLVAAVPVGYVLYHFAYLLETVRTTRLDSGILAVESSVGVVATLVILCAIGGGLSASSKRDLRAPWAVALVGLFVLPWVFPLSPIDSMGGPLLAVFVSTVGALGVEVVLRERTSKVTHLRTEPLTYGLTAGCGHLVFGVALHVVTRPASVVVASPVSTGLWLLAAVGTVFTGALPVYVWRRYGLRTPPVVLLVWMFVAVVRFWARWQSLPLSEFNAVRVVALRPYPDYLLQWPTLLLGILLVATVESSLLSGRRKSGASVHSFFRQ